MKSDEEIRCVVCANWIWKRTAESSDGLCLPCLMKKQTPDEPILLEYIFEEIETAIKPFSNHKLALARLRSLPLGYALCFAFQCVDTEIQNGGVSQFHSSPVWPLVLEAETAARLAGAERVANLLREIVYYYHRKNRSKLKRSLDGDYFLNLPSGWDKKIQELNDEYARLEAEANSVLLNLCRDHKEFFDYSTEY